METLSVMETLHRLSVLLTSLIFNIALYSLVVVQEKRGERGNRRFREVVFAVLFANAVTCIANFINYADIGEDVPRLIKLLSVMCLYLANMYLTFFFCRYIESYFGEKDAGNPILHEFNTLWIILMTSVTVIYYLFKLPSIYSPNWTPAPVFGMRMLIGYVTELYYLLYALVFYIRRRSMLAERVQTTVVWSFFITVLTIVLEYFNPTDMLVNYLGASIGLYLFYYGVETPDYRNLQQTMQELELAKQQAEEERIRADQANLAKSEFLAEMSHEIRTPINAVLGMNEMILRESQEAQINLYAQNVESAGKSLLSIINDILDFSKIEAGKIEIVEGEYQLSSVINDVSNMIFFKARKKGLDFKITVDETIPDKLYGDEVRIRQIIVNVLNNAVKYTEHGYVQLDIQGSRVPALEGEMRDLLRLEIAVTDTGMGIRREDMDKLFRKFERMDLDHNKTIEGTGLGLAITQHLLSIMGGDIKVQSVYGSGSTFTIILPQHVVSETPIGDYKEKARQTANENARYHEAFRAPDAQILVVDDTELNLQVVETMLKRTQIQIDTALSGIDALVLTKEKHYDLILMDQRMPEMDGTRALFEIRRQNHGLNQTTPIICLTADAVIGARDRYMGKGFTDYLTKPIEGTSLEAMLSRYLPPDKVHHLSEEELAADSSTNNIRKEPSALFRLYESCDKLSYMDAIHYQPEDQLIEILRSFYESIQVKSDEIETLLARDDISTYTTKVHALKSSARMLGINDLSEQARYLEACGDRVQSSSEEPEGIEARHEINTRTPQLLKDYRALGGILASLFEEEKGSAAQQAAAVIEAQEDITPEALSELIEALQAYASMLDYEDMEEVLKEARKYRLPEEEQERFAKLEQAAHALDTDSIMKLLGM
ncbi:MAG: response regulator [Butyrivibrio sp.]|nr:response regulator [Butyrivibrio sp.]